VCGGGPVGVGVPLLGAGVRDVAPVVVELLLAVVYLLDDELLLLPGHRPSEGIGRRERKISISAYAQRDLPQQGDQFRSSRCGKIVDQNCQERHHVRADLPAGALMNDGVRHLGERVTAYRSIC
jgi:hypothetical protein